MPWAGRSSPSRALGAEDAVGATPDPDQIPGSSWCHSPRAGATQSCPCRDTGTAGGPVHPQHPEVLTSKLLVRQALLVGKQEGEEPVQASRGPSGDDVEEDGSVEDLEDRGWVRSRPLGARRCLPAREAAGLSTAAASLLRVPISLLCVPISPLCASVSHPHTELRALGMGMGAAWKQWGAPVGAGGGSAHPKS